VSIGPISGKVTAATVAAASTTMVCNILGPYVFHGQVPSDIQGLIDSAIAAAVTFAAGYLARHVVPAAGSLVKAAEADIVPYFENSTKTVPAPGPVPPVPNPVVMPLASSQCADVPSGG
jgi:hypothetical protein